VVDVAQLVDLACVYGTTSREAVRGVWQRCLEHQPIFRKDLEALGPLLLQSLERLLQRLPAQAPGAGAGVEEAVAYLADLGWSVHWLVAVYPEAAPVLQQAQLIHRLASAYERLAPRLPPHGPHRRALLAAAYALLQACYLRPLADRAAAPAPARPREALGEDLFALVSALPGITALLEEVPCPLHPPPPPCPLTAQHRARMPSHPWSRTSTQASSCATSMLRTTSPPRSPPSTSPAPTCTSPCPTPLFPSIYCVSLSLSAVNSFVPYRVCARK
jgi:hypothetical protein